MKATDIPVKFRVPFANNAADSLIEYPTPFDPSGPGTAGLDAGFSALNFIDPAVGGIPPWGKNFNGILKQDTAWSRWFQAGGPIHYDAAFSAFWGGYPIGATLLLADGAGYYQSLVDDNTTDPTDTLTAVGWQLVDSEIVEALDGTPITLTTLDSSKNFNVTGNTTITLPVSADVRNGTNFSFNCAGGTAMLVPDPAVKIDGGAIGEAYTFPDGTGGLVVRDEDGNWPIFYFSGPGTGLYTTASLVARPGFTYLLDSTAGAFEITLPPITSSPATLVFKDVGEYLATNNVTLIRNGGTGTIQGIAADCRLDLSGFQGTLTNDGVGTNWRVLSSTSGATS